MHIVLASPLYPPDIAPPAPYVKELAKRLSEHHEVVIVVYGKLPEQVAGVPIIAVPKNRLLVTRLFNYTFALLTAAKKADVIYAQNGASVELPLFLVSFFTSTPFILGFGDKAAHERTSTHPLLRYVERAARSRAKAVMTTTPKMRPEILPFGPKPIAELEAYEASWNAHLEELMHLCADSK